jgi:D-alanine-D-alanine ligase
VLEMNANPCLAPDAGFVAAARQTGLGFDDIVERIMEDALRRSAQPITVFT